jgi:hypothetical protein
MAGEGKEGRVWKPGERFGLRDARARLVLDGPSAAYLNALVAELRRRNPLVGVPPVDVAEGSDGRSVSVALPRKIYAKLSGAGTGGQYSFVEQEWTGSAWADGGGNESGTNNAWESNHLAGLAGKVVLLRWEESSADWRFHWNAYGGCEAELCTTVTACGAYLAGATVTVKNVAETITYGSCTTDSHGRCCVGGLAVGDYHVIGSKTGYSTVTVDASIVPCTGVAPPIDLVPTTIKQICFIVEGCKAYPKADGTGWPSNADPTWGLFYVPGATVNLKRSGVTLITGTTDAAGHVCLTPADLNPYDVEIVKAGYVYNVPGPTWAFPLGPLTPNNRGTVASDPCDDRTYRAYLEADADHFCCGTLFDETVPLALTSSCGAIDLDWDPTSGIWVGCQSAPATQPVCDAYGNVTEVAGNVDITWTATCRYGPDGRVFLIRATWFHQCCVKSVDVYGNADIRRYNLASACPTPLFQNFLYGAHCPTIGGFNRCGIVYFGQVSCEITETGDLSDPFSGSCMMPDVISPGAGPGGGDASCGNIGNIYPTPPVRFPCPGMVTVS